MRTTVLALVLALICRIASAADPGNLTPAATEALAAVLANLESQARNRSETPAQLFRRSHTLWTDLQSQMRTLGTAMAEMPVQAALPGAARAIDAVIIEVARSYARDPAIVDALLDRYGSPNPGSEFDAAVRAPLLDPGDVVPDISPAWILLLMAPRTEMADFARPRALEALTQLRVRDALTLIELRANQDASDRNRLPGYLGAMYHIDPSLALVAYARCIPRARGSMANLTEIRPIYVRAVRNAMNQNPAVDDIARAMAANEIDPLVREVFAAAIGTP